MSISSTATACKIKWQSLRDYFLKKRRESSKKSGQAASTKRQWYLFERMSFLNPFVAARETSGNLDFIAPIEDASVGTEESVGAGQLSDSPQQLTSPEIEAATQISAGPSRNSGKKRKSSSLDIVDKEILKALQKEPDNEHELFFKSLIPTVSQLDPINTMLFRAEVQQLAVKYLRQQQLQAMRSPTPVSFFAPVNRETTPDPRFNEQY